MHTVLRSSRTLVAFLVTGVLLALMPAAASAAIPDPLDRGSYTVGKLDQFKAGLVNLQEPNSGGGATTGVAAAATIQIRGSLYYPADRTTPSPVLVLVHGNHSSCLSGSAPNCTVFTRNDAGYAYLGENLASHGYTVISLDQDQLMYYQDGNFGKGMHQRRQLISAALDAFYKANAEGMPTDENNNLGDLLKGKLDFNRIGLMGHSRGGDAVTSFIDYNRARPAPGRRYTLRGVIALAPTDYERKAPYGMAYMTEFGTCEGDVTNLQGARFFERSQYIVDGDPFPRIQMQVQGANHNWYNSVWKADGDDATTNDPACATSAANNIRLSGGTYVRPNPVTAPQTPENNTRVSGDPALMGDQNRIGLATMGAFFRRYVGGEVAFDPYMTGELSADGAAPQIPASACPVDGPAATRMACNQRVSTSYFPGSPERLDLLRPETDTALTETAVGTTLQASGFSNPYTVGGGVNPFPATTPNGLDWCNPDPLYFSMTLVGAPSGTRPTAPKACPLPADGALGGQAGTRENAPVNHSYGMQLATAWNDPVGTTGEPAKITVRVPAAKQNVSGYKALSMAAAVNFFDPRNPPRTAEALYNPAATTQDFTIAVTDASGTEATVSAANPRYGNALRQTLGNITTRVHIVLNQIRVPLSDLTAQGVDTTKIRKVELRFGEAGKPATGSIQLADVRFGESAAGTTVLADSVGGDGAGSGPVTSGPDPATLIAETPRDVASDKLPNAIGIDGSTTVSSCEDTVAPKLAVAGTSLSKGALALSGSASDTGCKTSKVASVQVKIAVKTAKKGFCRFASAKGKLSKPLPCGAGLAVGAKGTKSWKFKLGGALPKGTYSVSVSALDAGGNVTTSKAKTVTVA